MNRRDGLKLLARAPFAFASPFGFASDSPWSRAADIPFATQEIYPAIHRGEIVIAGGIGAKAGIPFFTGRCVAYCPSTNTWREHSTLPEARHHGALVEARSRLFLFGGFNGGVTHIWRMRASVLEFVDDEWVSVVDMPAKQAEGVAATSPLNRIHVVTGQSPKGTANRKRSDHREITKHWSWDPDETNWQEHAPIPTARNGATGGWSGNELIVAGGRTATGNLDTVEIYDLKSDSWRQGAPLPLPQAGTASVSVDDGLIVFGGEIFVPKSAVFKEVWRYSLSADRWTALPPLPIPRHGLGAVRFDSTVYVVGGARRPGGSGTSNAVEVFDLNKI